MSIALRHARQVSCVLPIVLCSCQAVPRTQFVNLTLPNASVFTPVVVHASETEIIVARVVYVEGLRDAQVLRQDRWNLAAAG